MGEQSSRSYLPIVAAILIAGALISASLLIAVGGASKASTKTSDVTITGTSTLTQSATNQTVDTAPPVQNFGSQYFEPPSGILIPANTLIWTNFQLNETTNAFVGASIVLFPFPDAAGVNVTVAVYVNGLLNVNSTTPLLNHDYGINSSLIPSANSSNSIFALTGLIPTVGMGTQTGSAVSLNNGTTITIAVSSDRSIWLAGWSQIDVSKGTGPQFGRSTGQLAGTYEASEPGTFLPPNLLPHATTTLTYELQISGALSQ